jgi:hypothetical protein
VDLDRILYESDDIKGDLDSILLNPVASTLSKCRTFNLLRWSQLLNRSVDMDEILYGDNGIEGDLESMLFNSVASSIKMVDI